MRGDAVMASVLLGKIDRAEQSLSHTRRHSHDVRDPGDIERAEKRLDRMREDHSAVVARLAEDEVAEYEARTRHLKRPAPRTKSLLRPKSRAKETPRSQVGYEGDVAPLLSAEAPSTEMDEFEELFWEPPAEDSGQHKFMDKLRDLTA